MPGLFLMPREADCGTLRKYTTTHEDHEENHAKVDHTLSPRLLRLQRNFAKAAALSAATNLSCHIAGVDNSSMEMTLRDLLTDKSIRRLAGPQYYARGQNYVSDEQASILEADDEHVEAAIQGTLRYRVTIRVEKGAIVYSCTCPIGRQGEFCKHCVATALTWRAKYRESASRKNGKSKRLSYLDAVKTLREDTKENILDLVLAWAKENDWVEKRILLYASRRVGPEYTFVAVKRAFDDALDYTDYIPYAEAAGWAKSLHSVIDAMERVLEDGHATTAMQLCEHGISALDAFTEMVDDSDGHLCDLLDRLATLHLSACRKAKPDPIDLARRLLDWELHNNLDMLLGAAVTYQKVLGKKGLAAYRKLAETAWSKVPIRGPGDPSSRFGDDFRITYIMEALAKSFGGLQERISIMSRDLSSSYGYLRIAQVFQEVGDFDAAMQWAEDGRKAFPVRTDVRLRKFLAEVYHQRNRHDDALELIWEEFVEHPYLNTYEQLQTHAERANAWTLWRERALQYLRKYIRSQSNNAWWNKAESHSTLVEIFLYEKNPDQAWHEATTGGCSDRLWLEVATHREINHPSDAAAVYLRVAKDSIARGGGRYEEAVALLVNAATAMKRAGMEASFSTELNRISTVHRAKRNFTKLIEKKRKELLL